MEELVEGERGGSDAGNLLKVERRQIEGKCGRTIATEPRASDGPAGIVISTLSLGGALLVPRGVVSFWRSK